MRWKINIQVFHEAEATKKVAKLSGKADGKYNNLLLLQVLAESDQLRKEADDLGPRAELDHWKKRMSRFNYLLDQLKSPDVKAVLGVLLMAKSKLIKVGLLFFFKLF